MSQKPEITLGFIGHLNHGKSSTIIRLLLETGKISNDEVEEIRNRVEKEELDFSPLFMLDSLREERERRITIDLSHKEFESDNYQFKIIDMPGHRDFIKNTITGLAQTEVGVITVAADEGIQPQTIEHTYLSKTLDVKQFVVLINKIDLIAYEEDEFERIKEEVETMLNQVGIEQRNIDILPISALQGDNITESSENMEWYEGPTLLDTLNSLNKPIKPVERDARMPIRKTEIRDGETFILGRIETGEITRGDKIVLEPASTRQNQNIGGEVKKIEQHRQEVEEAEPGDHIALKVKGIREEDVEKGDVAGHEDRPPKADNKFEAQIIVLNHPDKLKPGYTAIIHVNNLQTLCTFTEIKETKNPETGKRSEKPEYVEQGQEAIVEIKTKQDIVIEENDDIPQLSRFAIRDGDGIQTIGAGKCLKTLKHSTTEEENNVNRALERSERRDNGILNKICERIPFF